MRRLKLAHCFLDVMKRHCASQRGKGPAADSEELGKRLKTMEDEKKKRKMQLEAQAFSCVTCGIARSYADYLEPSSLYLKDADLRAAIQKEIVEEGELVRCQLCKKGVSLEQSATTCLKCQTCGETLPRGCFLDRPEQGICIKHGGYEFKKEFQCTGSCGKRLRAAHFGVLQLFRPLRACEEPSIPCLDCGPASPWSDCDPRQGI